MFNSYKRVNQRRANYQHRAKALIRQRLQQRKTTFELLEDRRLLTSNLGSDLIAEGESELYLQPQQQLVWEQLSFENGDLSSELRVADPSNQPVVGAALQLNGLPLSGREPAWNRDGSIIILNGPGAGFSTVNAFSGKNLPILDLYGEPVTGHAPVWIGSQNNLIGWVGATVDPQSGNSNWDILYGSIVDEGDHYRMTNMFNVTTHPAADFNPSWSSDGQYVVFQSDRSGATDIYRINRDDVVSESPTPALNLTANRPTAGDFNPQFSPDDQSIVFVSSSGNSNLWVMNADGSDQRQLTAHPSDDLSPSWSPDSTKVLFHSFRPTEDGSIDPELYLIDAVSRKMDTTGAELVQLTNNSQFDSNATLRALAPIPADLAVHVSQPSEQIEGQSFNLSVTISNSGYATAQDVLIGFSPDHRMEIESIQSPGGGQATYDELHGILSAASLSVGSSLTWEVTVRAFEPGYLKVFANATSSTRELTSADNQAEVGTIVRPRNDNFTSASTISGAVGNIEAANFFATHESTILGSPEPAHGFSNSNQPQPASGSIWYRWFSPSAGRVSFNTRGSDFDTLLSAYIVVESSRGKFLSRLSTNDDAAGTTSEISFDTSDGADYYIAVDGYGVQQGAVLLNWSQRADEAALPKPQRIQSISQNSALVGSGQVSLKVRGSGFGVGSRVYIYDSDQTVGSRDYRSANFLQTIIRNDKSELETVIPASWLGKAKQLRLVVVRGNYESNPVNFEVTSSQILPSGSTLNLGKLKLSANVITLMASGSGEGEGHEEVYKLSGNVQFNDYLLIEGASISVSIRRSNNTMKVEVKEGRIVLTNLPVYGNVTLWSGRSFEYMVDGDGALTNLLRATVETPLRSRGIDITLDRAHMLLGDLTDPDGQPIYGIEIYGSMKFNQLFGLINLPIRFDKFVLTRNKGLQFAAEIGPLNFGINNLFSLSDVYFSYRPGATPDLDSFSGRGRIETPVGINAEGNLEVIGGMLSSVGGELELPTAAGLPIGPITLTGGGLNVENLLNLSRLRIAVQADATILHSAVAKVLKLDDVSLYYQLPASLGGAGSLQIMSVNAASAHLDLDIPSNSYSFGGNVTLLPNFPVFDIRGELTATFGRKVDVSGYAQGTIQIPDGNGGLYDVLKACGTVPWLGIQVGPCMRFPVEIASARVTYKDNAFSYSTSLPLLGNLSMKIKRLQNDVQATIDLFNNLGKVSTQFRFGGSGEGDNPGQEIGDMTVVEGTPRLVVSVAGIASAPMYDLVSPSGQRYTPEAANGFGATYFFNDESFDSIYVIEYPEAGTWTAIARPEVTDVVSLEAWGANQAPEIDYVGASVSNNLVDITYSARDADNDAKISLYYTQSPTLTNGTLITDELSEASFATYTWNPAEDRVPAGKYFIYAMVDDGINVPAWLHAFEPITIEDPLAPNPPTDVNIASIHENSAVVQWTASSSENVAGYIVRYAVDDGPDTVLNQQVVVAGNATEAHLRGLSNLAGYRIEVLAYNRTEEANPFNTDHNQIVNRLSLPAPAVFMTTGTAESAIVAFVPFETTKLFSGSSLELSWTAELAEDLQSQQLFVSTDAGQSFTLLTQLDPDVRQYTWQVPTANASQARFRLLTRDSANNEMVIVSPDFAILNSGSLSFSTSAIKIREDVGVAEITVMRTGGSAGVAVANFITRAGSATAGQDFEFVQGQIVMADGEIQQQLFIPIVNDVAVEDLESFTVWLLPSADGSQLGNTSSLTISIENEDIVTDTDDDGILDSEENLAPNGGDGNRDGILDSLQSNVVSLAAGGLAGGVTLVLPSGVKASEIAWMGNGQIRPLPSGLTPTMGVLRVELPVPTRGSMAYSLIQHSSQPADAYLHLTDHWSFFMKRNSLGAEFGNNGVLTIAATDGARGDSDGVANGIITLQAVIGQVDTSSPHRNPINALDVNADDIITPADALLIINELNSGVTGVLSPPSLPRQLPLVFLDSSGNGLLTASDALLVINFLNDRSTGGGEGEPAAWPDSSTISAIYDTSFVRAQADTAALVPPTPVIDAASMHSNNHGWPRYQPPLAVEDWARIVDQLAMADDSSIDDTLLNDSSISGDSLNSALNRSAAIDSALEDWSESLIQFDPADDLQIIEKVAGFRSSRLRIFAKRFT